MNTKLIRLEVKLKSTGWEENTTELDINETENGFTYKGESGRRRIIHRNRVMVAESKLIDSLTLKIYTAYCLPDQVDEALKLLRDAISASVMEDHEKLLQLVKHIQS